jgi:hypothetical protein
MTPYCCPEAPYCHPAGAAEPPLFAVVPGSPGDCGIWEELPEEELPEEAGLLPVGLEFPDGVVAGALWPPAPGPLYASLSCPSSRLVLVPGMEFLSEELLPELLLPEELPEEADVPVLDLTLTSFAAMFPPPV